MILANIDEEEYIVIISDSLEKIQGYEVNNP